MSRKGQRTKGLEKAHPFQGMNRVNLNAAGVDIGAVEIVACVSGDDDTTQLVRAFGNYTVDLQALGRWLKSYGIKQSQWKARVSTGYRYLKNWSVKALNAC